jgi:ketosteroid isomerase-like protein
MSQENVEVARAAYGAWNAGDMDALRELLHPDVFQRSPEGWPEPGPFVGREAVMRWWEQLREVWDADALEPISFIDAGDRVVVRQIWRGAGHGPETNLELTNVFTVRKGRIFYLEFFWDHAEALETLGLSDHRVSQENVELARKVLDTLATRDASRLISLSDPDVEWHSFFALAEGGVYRGQDGTRRYMSDLNDAFEIGRADVDDALAVGEVAVLVGRIHFRGKGSGVESKTPAGWMLKFRDGKVLCFRAFREPEQALEAAGLSE